MAVLDVPKTVAGVTIPDSRVARDAVELAYEPSSPMLFNHVMRSYVLGKLTADVVDFGLDGVKPALVAEVVRTFPRHHFNRDYFALLLDEAREKPESRVVHPVHMVVHHCCGGVPIPDARAMIAASPFDE